MSPSLDLSEQPHLSASKNPVPRPFTVAASSAYEMLVRGVVDYAIYMLDLDGRVISWNTGAERIKGYTQAEILGEHFSRFYTEEDRTAGVPDRALRTAREHGRFAAEGWRVRKTGERFWAMVVIDGIYQNGELIAFAKVTRDITEKREAQLAQSETERRFRLLVEGVTDYAIYMLNPSGHVANWNAGAQRIQGYKEAEILGEHFSRFYTQEDKARGSPAVALDTARRDGRYGAEGWRVRRDGSRFWASVVIDAIYDGPKLIGFAKITRDLTERREAELRLEHSRALLAQAEKLDAVGQLTAGMAHDFNNLLTGILGSLEILGSRIAAGRTAGLERLIAAAEENARRAATLTHGMLAFSGRQTLAPKLVDVNALVTELQPLIRRMVQPAVEVSTQLKPGLWKALCDPGQLETALLALCKNARDAMPGGGRLSIATDSVVVGEQDWRDAGLAPGKYVSITVDDTGIGMGPEVAARAFDPFFTTKPMGGGAGLGLSMVHGFARQSGGKVHLRSHLGAGTTAQILLPHQAADDSIAEPPFSPDARRTDQRPSVLVVDDEPTVLMLIHDILEDLGCDAREAKHGQEALDVLRSDQRVDLLISDVGLPGMNGTQVAEAARALRPGLKVLFITGYAESHVLDATRLPPGMQLLTKPFAVNALTQRIQALLSLPA